MFIWISIITTATALGLLIYWLAMPGLASSSDDLQRVEVNRGWRWFWPWIRLLAQLAKPFMSWHYRLKVEAEVELAGRLDYLKAEHVFAMQLGAGVGGVVFGLLLGWWQSLSGWGVAVCVMLVGSLGAWLPRYSLKKAGAQRQKDMLKQFPFFLDMMTLSVEGGLNFQSALLQTHHLLPVGALRVEFERALSDMRAGVTRLDALKALAKRTALAEVSLLVSSIAQSQQLGMALGPILRAQSEQRRNERFLKAEKLALEAPVKMLFPLVTCIFPCTFLVIAFPIAMTFFTASW